MNLCDLGESKRFIKESSVNDPLLNPTVKVITEPIRTLNCPSLETFSAEHFYPRLPVKLTGQYVYLKKISVIWKHRTSVCDM